MLYDADVDIISIHAPRTGSDPTSSHSSLGIRPFQSTLPARGATRYQAHHQAPQRFQSTLPARGATIISLLHGKAAEISIHAPRTGSDGVVVGVPCCCCVISIHAPRTGSDVFPVPLAPVIKIFQSTLPARGATRGLFVVVLKSRDFNPRSPHGERLAAPQRRMFWQVFQSTLPARGATRHAAADVCVAQFQSTLPARGATIRSVPLAGETNISIHAPRTGSDCAK